MDWRVVLPHNVCVCRYVHEFSGPRAYHYPATITLFNFWFLMKRSWWPLLHNFGIIAVRWVPLSSRCQDRGGFHVVIQHSVRGNPRQNGVIIDWSRVVFPRIRPNDTTVSMTWPPSRYTSALAAPKQNAPAFKSPPDRYVENRAAEMHRFTSRLSTFALKVATPLSMSGHFSELECNSYSLRGSPSSEAPLFPYSLGKMWRHIVKYLRLIRTLQLASALINVVKSCLKMWEINGGQVSRGFRVGAVLNVERQQGVPLYSN